MSVPADFMASAVCTALLATLVLKALCVVGTPSAKKMTIFFAPGLACRNAVCAAVMPLSAGVAPLADSLFTDDFRAAVSLVRELTTPEFCPNWAMAIRTLLSLSWMVSLVVSVASMKLVAASFSAVNRFGFDLLHPLWLPSMQ